MEWVGGGSLWYTPTTIFFFFFNIQFQILDIFHIMPFPKLVFGLCMEVKHRKKWQTNKVTPSSFFCCCCLNHKFILLKNINVRIFLKRRLVKKNSLVMEYFLVFLLLHSAGSSIPCQCVSPSYLHSLPLNFSVPASARDCI